MRILKELSGVLQLWECISREQRLQGSRPCLSPATDAREREHSNMNMDVRARLPIFHRFFRYINTIHLGFNYSKPGKNPKLRRFCSRPWPFKWLGRGY